MCGCGNKARTGQTPWTVTYADGSSKEFPSSTQARLAASRSPGATAAPKAA